MQHDLIITKDRVLCAMQIIARNNKREDFPISLVNDVYFAIRFDQDHHFKAQVMNIILMNQYPVRSDLQKYAPKPEVEKLRRILPKKTHRERLAELCGVEFKTLNSHLMHRLKLPNQWLKLYKQNVEQLLSEFDDLG